MLNLWRGREGEGGGGGGDGGRWAELPLWGGQAPRGHLETEGWVPGSLLGTF